MRGLLPVYLVVLALGATGTSRSTEPEYSASIHLSCHDSPFLSISAQTPRRDNFPDVELRLTDPLGRHAGSGSHDHQIPNAQYGKIVEIPTRRPSLSKAVAVEVCNAIAGRYIFTVTEHGKAEYRVSVSGADGKYLVVSEVLNLSADGDRTCQYRFLFSMPKSKANIRWLDNKDRPLAFLQHPVCAPVPRA